MSYRREIISAAIGAAAMLGVVGAFSCNGGGSSFQSGTEGCKGGLAPYKMPESSDPESGLAKLSEADKNIAIVTVNGVSMPLAELQDRLDRQSPYIRTKYQDPTKRKELLDQLVQFEVLAQAAAEAGYASNPEVLRQTKQAMIQKYVDATFGKKFSVDSITDDEIGKYYEEHKADYNKPEQSRVAHILVKTKAEADTILAQATAKKDDLKEWKDLVSKNSLDADTKEKGGDLGYFAADDTKLPKTVVDAGFAMKNNGELQVVQSDKGFHVVKLTGKRKEIKRELADVKKQIQQILFQERRKVEFEKFVGELKAKATISTKEDALPKLIISQTAGANPLGGLPGGLPAGINPQALQGLGGQNLPIQIQNGATPTITPVAPGAVPATPVAPAPAAPTPAAPASGSK